MRRRNRTGRSGVSRINDAAHGTRRSITQFPDMRRTVRNRETGNMRKQKIINDLKDAIENAKFENASFGDPTLNRVRDFPEFEKDVTPWIKERTRLFRETWIIPFLESALAEIEHGKR
jgi:hypothetical protein